jgi:hypothetical protein
MDCFFWVPILIGAPILAFKIVLLFNHLRSGNKIELSDTEMDTW